MTPRYSFSRLVRCLLPSLALAAPAAAQRPHQRPRPFPPPLVDSLPPVTIVGWYTERERSMKVCDCRFWPGGCPSTTIYVSESSLTPFLTIQPALSRAAGVQVTPNSGAPGDWATVRIRGSSLGSNDQPLYLLDGLPALNADYVPGPLALLNPPLGPAQVQAGAAAPNPLLFVPPSDIDHVEVLKGALATARYGSQGANGVINIVTRRGGRRDTPQPLQLHYEAQAGVQQVRQRPALLDARQYADLANEVWRNAGSQGAPPFNAAALAGLSAGTDWQRAVLQAALLQSHQLSLGGSTPRTRYQASAGYLGQGGVVLNSQLRRYTLRLNLDHAPAPGVRLWLSAAGAVVTRTLPPAFTVAQALLAPPTVAATTSSGEPAVTSAGPPVATAGFAAPFFNPLALALQAPTTDATRRLLVQAGASWQLRPALRLEGRLSEELAVAEATRRELRQPLPASPTAPVVTVPTEALRIAQHLATANAQASLLYERPAAGRHAIAAEAALLAQYVSRREELTDPTVTWPPLGTSSASGQMTVLSALATGSYTYAGRLQATVLLRADLNRSAGLRLRDQDAQLYPGLEVSWDVTKEPFWPGSRVLSDLRLAVAGGQCGSSALPAAGLGAASSGAYRTVLSSLSLSSPPLPRATQLNATLTAGLLNGHLLVQPTFYRHQTAHASVAQYLPVPTLQGQPTYLLTGRDVTLRNQGVELTVTGYFRSASDQVSLTTQLAAAYNHFTALAIEGAQPVPGLAVGEGYHPFFGLQRAGLSSTGALRYRDTNGDGQLNYADTGYFGTGIPPWLLNFSEELRVGRFTLQTQLDALLGYQLLNTTLFRLDYPSADVNASTRVLDRWTPAHPNTDVPAADYYGRPYGYDDQSAGSASHLRLSQLTLAFQVRPAAGPRPVQVWVGGQNLWVLSNYRGYDPNVSSGGSLGQQAGYDANTYPVARVWQLGLRATL